MKDEDPQGIRDQIEVTPDRIADPAEALPYQSDVPERVKKDSMEDEDPQGIRDQIEITRDHIADTAEALAYKSDVPARMKEDIADRVDTAKTAASDVAATAASSLASAADAALKGAQDLSEAAKPVIADAAATLAGAADTAKSAFADATANAREPLSSGSAGSVDLTENMRQNVGVPSSDEPRNLVRSARTYVRENPLAVALGTIAVGFLISFALPGRGVERKTDSSKSNAEIAKAVEDFNARARPD